MVVTDANGTVAQNTFLSTTYRNMITFPTTGPQPQYQFIAAADGSQCGVGSLPVGASLASGSAQGNLTGISRLFVGGIISRWKYAAEVNAWGLTGNASHQILHFKLDRNQRLFFGLINNSRNLALIDRFEPSFNTIPWESVPAGIVGLGERLNTGNFIELKWSIFGYWFAGMKGSFTLADHFGFGQR